MHRISGWTASSSGSAQGKEPLKNLPLSARSGSGSKAAKTPAFNRANTALGNIKAAITGTYRSISPKHVPRYLAEFECRFIRRYDLAATIPRLTWASVRTPPMPYRLLKLAEVHA